MSLFYWSQLATVAAINAIAALGLYVTIVSGQLSSAHAALAGLAGYTTGVLALQLHWPLPLTLLAAAVASAVVGAGLSRLVANLQGFYLAIATLAFAETLVVVVTNVKPLGGADGLSNIPIQTTLPLALASALVITLGVRLWEGSRPGLAARAVGEDPVAAACAGIAVPSVKIRAFALGGLLAGYSGALHAHYIGLVAPSDMSFQALVTLFFYVGIGGMGTYAGAVVGAVVVTIIPELLRFSTYDRYLVFGLVLAGMMLVRPFGLIVRRPLGSRSTGASNPLSLLPFIRRVKPAGNPREVLE
jgi:branched-chain amino acid transport system permease protein